MRKLRKLLSIAAICAFVLPLAACGAALPAETDTEDETASAEEMETDGMESESSEDSLFEPFTAIDSDDCEVVIEGINPDGVGGYLVEARLLNNTKHKNLTFFISCAAVNGVEIDPQWESTVIAGYTSDEEIWFDSEDLDEAGIVEVTDIQLFFRVYDPDDPDADYIADEDFHIYPLGEEAVEEYVREPRKTDTVLLDNDDIAVIALDCYENELDGYSVDLYIENRSERDLMVSADNVFVNSSMIDPWWSVIVHAGNSEYSRISWSDAELEDNDVTEVEEIGFDLDVIDLDDESEDSLYNEKVTLNP
ncbi:MAG: hypothetical protein ACOX8B_05175 [Lachnospiraceae bacterium]